MKQKSIKQEFSFEGVGVHFGIEAKVLVKPDLTGQGFTFVRTDIKENNKFILRPDNIVNTERCTTAGFGNVTIATIEHFIAAAFSLGINNLIVEINAPEMPILDGSSYPFIELFKKAGIQELTQELPVYNLTETIIIESEDKKSRIIAIPNKNLEFEVSLDFNSKVVHNQNAELNNINLFEKNISLARTFCFFHEIKTLVEMGLVQSKNLDSGVVFLENPLTNEERTKLDMLFPNKLNEENIKNNILNTKLRYPNEPAKHKLLDLVGDLGFFNFHLNAKIIAHRPGHKINNIFARKIYELYKNEVNNKNNPKYDPNKPPLYTVEQVKKFLPHRAPFLFVDKILEKGDDYIVGLKNITFNEYMFVGHFPNDPIFPGVLIIESMAQVGGVLILSGLEKPEEYVTYFMKMNKVRFIKPVRPGDTIIYHCSMRSPFRRGIIDMLGLAYVNNKLVAEAELMAFLKKIND